MGESESNRVKDIANSHLKQEGKFDGTHFKSDRLSEHTVRIP